MKRRAVLARFALPFAFCGLTMLAGCGASAPIHYYRLDALDLDSPAASEPRAILAVGPIVLPDYLQRRQLVRRGRGAEMQLDEQNHWAEPLDEAVPRIVAANVDGLAAEVVAVAGARGVVRADYRLFATVHRFDTDSAGSTVLVVQWGVTGAERATVVAPRTTRYRAAASPADQPGAVAAAMSDVLAQFSRDVAEALPAEPPPERSEGRRWRSP